MTGNLVSRSAWRSIGWMPTLLLAALTAVSGISLAMAAATPQGIPATDLATGPLYAGGVRAKPTLTLALSVEYPTVGPSYRNEYAAADTFLGYFNPDLCYLYDADTDQFDPKAAASAHHTCGGTGFSGNFMNWATTSSIDILRYALTGGDRIIDTAESTVLQRAVLPDGSKLPDGSAGPASFYNNDSFFPPKSISKNEAAGAMPAGTMRKKDGKNGKFEVYDGKVYIANCLNRVFFGTKKTGTCDAPGNNGDLGQIGSVANSESMRPNDGGGGGGQCRRDDDDDDDDGQCPSQPPPGPMPDGSNSFHAYFLTRVSVCESMSGPTADTRTVNGVGRNFCHKYPSGKYKPTGDLQTYSDKVRVAAFGYLMDSDEGRYGGVLRAPMKYVGPTAYDSNFNLIAGGNPQAEWNTTTGQFIPNPMATNLADKSNGISGVINYLNQFGRSGDTPGAYKQKDPVGELYYEALRYLQGLPPTPDAYFGMTDPATAAKLKDGFPVYTDGPSTPDDDAKRTADLPHAPKFVDPQPPINGLGTTGDYRCVANNIITIGDINTHQDASLPGFAGNNVDKGIKAAPELNMPNFVFWTGVLAGFETRSNISYIDGSGTKRYTDAAPGNLKPISGNANLETAKNQYNNRFYLDGAAYWANTHDIRGVKFTGTNTSNQMAWADSVANQRPGMRVTSYAIDVNEKSGSSNLRDRQKLNQYFLMGKYGGFKAGESLGDNPFIAANGNAATLWERGNTGDPQNYFLASDAAAMIQALDKIFVTATADTSGIAGTSVTSPSVTVGSGSVAYRSSFAPADWSSDLYPVTLSTDASNTLGFSAEVDAPWHASARLDVQIALNDGTGWKDRNIFAGVGDASSSTVATAFSDGGLNGTQRAAIFPETPTAQADRLAYLQGDRSNESPSGEKFRKRIRVLGDIINSGIVYEGRPNGYITDASYSGSPTSFYEKNKNRTAAVYVGANDGMLHAFEAETGDELFAYIPSQVLPNMASLVDTGYIHKPFVDATPVVGEAQLGSAASDWRTVLVGGLGGGGQGVYALDVTDPTAFDASKALWEFTDKDDADMGNVIGKPGIYKFRTSLPDAATQTTGWFAVVASGVNNYVADDYASADGKPVIFILDLSKAKGTAWTEDTNYWKIKLPQTLPSRATGVANFSVYAVNGVVANIYAGDLQGNMWALDFTKVSKAGWNFGGVSTRTTQKPLFIARDSSGVAQQITAAPEITGYGNNLILLFGTGRYLTSSDNSAPYAQQTAYAILDPVGTNPSPATYLRDKLQPLTAGSGLVSGEQFAWGVPANAATNTYSGWYFDIPGSSGNGERFVSDFQVVSATVFANSIIPASGGCTAGTSNSYQLSLFGGGGVYTPSSSGMLGAPVLVSVGIPANGINPQTGQATQTQTIVPVNFGSSGISGGNTATVEQEIGVRSWRQIFSYKEIKAATP